MRITALMTLSLFLIAGANAADFPREKLDDTGFETIFDGKSLKGWHVSTQTGHSRASMHTSGGKWKLEEGAIVGSQDIPGNGGIILTDRLFGNFEVIVEMKNDFGPDSGLFLRSTERGQAYQRSGGGDVFGQNGRVGSLERVVCQPDAPVYSGFALSRADSRS